MSGVTSAWERFWHRFEVLGARVVLLRAAFFGLLGVDGFLQVSHAARYGAGGFNVSHFPALDGVLPLPRPALMLGLFLLQSFLAFRVALGVVDRLGLALLAAVYGAGYFISQVNSYQHHYLVFLLLVLACFTPWAEVARRPLTERHRSWALRLIMVQISLLYLWAAVAKMDPAWLSGQTLSIQVPSPETRGWIVQLASSLGLQTATMWSLMGWTVMVGELIVAIGWQLPRAWPVVLPLGLSFHVGVELLGYKIGLFSYFMMALYLLIVPERVMAFVGGHLEGLRQRVLTHPVWQKAPRGATWPLEVGLLVVGCAPLVLLMPFEQTFEICALMVGVALLAEYGQTEGRLRRAALQAAAMVLIAAVHLSTTQVRDFYRYLGGDARRRGEIETAIEAYTRVTQVAPDYAQGYVRLGDLYLRTQDIDGAVGLYEQALEVDPELSSAWARMARIHSYREEGEEAREAALRALSLPMSAKGREEMRKILVKHGGEPARLPTPGAARAPTEEGEGDGDE